MTAPRVVDYGFDRAGAKRAGYTDAEIDAYLAQQRASADPLKPSTPRLGSESTRVDRDRPTPGTVYANDPVALARQAGQGALLGFADEAEAAARAPFSKSTHGEIVGDIRAKNKAFSDAHPIASGAAQLGGGLLTGGAIAKALKVAQPAATAGGRIVQSLKAGTITGGVAGAGAGEGTGRVGGAVSGALLGGAVGGVIGGVAEGARAAAPWVRDAIANVTKATGPKAREQAVRKLVTDLERAGLTPEQIESQLAEIPSDVPYTLLDLGGENVRSRGAAVAAVPGPGKATLTDALQSRRQGGGDRVVGAFQRATGGDTQNTRLTTDAMKAARGVAADAEYGAAREAGKALLPEEYRTLLESPTIRKVYSEVTDQLSEAGKEIVPLYEAAEIIAPDGSKTVGQIVMDHPNVETLDYVYRALRDKAKAAYKADKSLAAREYKALANRVKGLLDDPELGVPEYTAARANFAKASRDIEAREAGAAFDKLQPEELTATLAGFDDDAAAQYRAGATRNVFQRVQKRGRNLSAIDAVDRNAEQRAQSMALAGDNAPELGRRLDAERTMDETFRKTLVGSRTTPLAEGVKDLGGSEWDTLASAIEGGRGGAKESIVKGVIGYLRARGQVGRGQTAEELGKLLSAGAGPSGRVDLESVLDLLKQARTRGIGTSVTRRPGVGPTRTAQLSGATIGRLLGSGFSDR